MTYLQKNNNSTVWQKIIWGGIVCVICIGLRFFFGNFFSNTAFRLATPLWHTLDSILGVQTQNQTVNQQANTAQSAVQDSNAGDVQALQSQIYNLQLKNIELSTQVSTLTELTSIQSLQTAQNRITAKIISKPPYTPFDIFILGSGSVQGIGIGSLVYIGDNTLIGTITKLEQDDSEVTLLSSQANTYDTQVLRTGEAVTIHGAGGGNFTATLPKDFDITSGDVLVDGSAKHHIITEIYSIDTASQGSFKTIYGRLPVNIFQSEWVGVDKTNI
jgi:cell shape-determining protein MreC